jgi:hypothetical protein
MKQVLGNIYGINVVSKIYLEYWNSSKDKNLSLVPTKGCNRNQGQPHYENLESESDMYLL